jgi:GH24 family phage-related lysozyme (muramidase)
MTGWLEKYTKMQNGGKKKFLEPNDKKLPLGRINPFYYEPSSELAASIGGEDGEPAYLIPSFKYGMPLNNPVNEFIKTGEHLGGPFKTWQEADEWDKIIRHHYVEKNQSLPSPLKRWGKDYKNGGWLDKYKAQDGRTVSPEEKYNQFLRLNEEVRYTPYRDRRGKGAKLTIGIGHLITPKEKKIGLIHGIPFKKSLSDEQVNVILENDLKEKHDSMNDFLQENYNMTANDLSDTKRYALLDLQYNSRKGLKAFPKFVDAVVKGDYNTQLQEYKRTFKEKGRIKPLKLRNETYLKNYVIPSVSEDIVTERIKSGKLQFTPDMESIQERAEKIVDERFAKGGTVKHDNLGYWNPDNWGEVVEINSPNITMRNVNVPLLGISDEGDTKMMTPGKDYKFKGKKVKEYPVAKYGINELYQLQDFSNKPSNWLQKYS